MSTELFEKRCRLIPLKETHSTHLSLCLERSGVRKTGFASCDQSASREVGKGRLRPCARGVLMAWPRTSASWPKRCPHILSPETSECVLTWQRVFTDVIKGRILKVVKREESPASVAQLGESFRAPCTERSPWQLTTHFQK